MKSLFKQNVFTKGSKKWLRLFDTPEKRVFYLGALLGCIAFFLVYNPNVLDFTFDSWLLRGGDLQQHYIGWKAFRASEWMTLPGMGDQLSYPLPLSVIYMDSIPIFALFFKLLSPILPEVFQYFGLWGFLCYTLQGALSALIIYKMCHSYPFSVIGCLFFVFSPPFFQRMFGHTSLASHFIILTAIYIWFFSDGKNIKKQVLIWSGIGALCASVHPYFIPMIGLLVCGCVTERIIHTKQWVQLVLPFVFCISVLATIFFLGGFATPQSLVGSGSLGKYSANLNSFFNNLNIYNIFKPLPSRPNQYEGMCYLGAGMIFLGTIALCCSVVNLPLLHKKSDGVHARKIAVFSTCFILLVFSLSPVVTLGGQVLVEIPIPNFVQKLWSTFQSTGRFTWPILYFIFIWALYQVSKGYKKSYAIAFLSVALSLQFMDVMDVHIRNGIKPTKETTPAETILTSKYWRDFPEFKHMELVCDIPHPNQLLDLANFAVSHQMTINRTYYARFYVSIWEQITKSREKINAGDAQDNEVFLFSNFSFPYEYLTENLLYLYKMDDIFTIGTISPVEGFSQVKTAVDLLPLDPKYVEDGQEMIVQPQSFAYTPATDLSAGTYFLHVLGEEVKEDTVKITISDSSNGEFQIDSGSFSPYGTSGYFGEFSLSQGSGPLKIKIDNFGDSPVIIKNVIVGALSDS